LFYQQHARPRTASASKTRRVCHVFGTSCSFRSSRRDDLSSPRRPVVTGSKRSSVDVRCNSGVRMIVGGDGHIAQVAARKANGRIHGSSERSCSLPEWRTPPAATRFVSTFVSIHVRTAFPRWRDSRPDNADPCSPQKAGHILASHPQRASARVIVRARRTLARRIPDSTQGGAAAVTARK
jgi:hypothetical protein